MHSGLTKCFKTKKTKFENSYLRFEYFKFLCLKLAQININLKYMQC